MLLVAMPLLLVVRPGAPSSFFAPSSDAPVTSSDALVTSTRLLVRLVADADEQHVFALQLTQLCHPTASNPTKQLNWADA